MSVPLFVPYPTLTFAPIFLAEDLDLLRRMTPEITVVVGGHERYLDILTGSGEGIVPILHMGLRAYDRGYPFRIICTIFHEVVHRIVTQPDVSGLLDLRGKTFMVNAFRGASDLEARYVLRKAGLAPEEVHFVEAGPDLEMAQLHALRRGEVAGIASSAPFWFIAQREGFRIHEDIGRFYAHWVPAALIVRASWADEHGDLIRRLQSVFAIVTEFIRTHRTDLLSLLLPRIPELAHAPDPDLIDHMRRGWNPAQHLEGLRNYIDAYCEEFASRKPRLDEILVGGTNTARE